MLLLTLLLAAEAHYSSPYDAIGKAFDRCVDAAAESPDFDADYAQCSKAELKARDAALSRRYAIVMKRSSPAQRERLRASERLWIQERDQNCQAEANAFRAEANALKPGAWDHMFRTCLTRYTWKRTEWLETQ
ncbi:lysozyme inhibitor LprI family protein [Sphingomonas alpina]|uniref:DUF1311 domain-containing protein n=1 Tax=Sphingomonas alpina TaxID=653931 RepID=A0A7H0LFC6_9SPHN|nr:lysozyme inhibitor LprI family protein [Sphingomonas alpina]QNQ08379.1 DUF1311 domain-containing protein [Sphingomonas alpina]